MFTLPRYTCAFLFLKSAGQVTARTKLP